MLFGGGRCPTCGERGDEELHSENSSLRKNLNELTVQFSMLEKKNELQEDVIKEQIRSIYDFIKSEKETKTA